MSFEPVLNELSLEPPAPDIPEARRRMSRFITTFVTATGTYRLKRTLRVQDEQINCRELAPGYPLAQWRNDKHVPRDEREFFRVLETKHPFLIGHADKAEGALTMDCQWNCKPAFGFQTALLLDSLAMSIPSDPAWNMSRIAIVVRELDHDGEWLPERTELIPHAGRIGHLKELADWIRQRQREGDGFPTIQTGTELWEQCGTLYSSLEFCPAVQKQLRKHAPQQDHMRAIRLRLSYLDQYSEQWRTSGGGFDKEQLSGNASPESQQTLQHPEYGPKREFECPDGQQRVFSWHLKIYGLNWRIHFFPDEERQTIIVGYIGPHLPTVIFPT